MARIVKQSDSAAVSGTSAGGFVAGVRHALRGFRLITAPGVRGFVVVPLLINISLFVLALIGTSHALDAAVARYLASWPEWSQWIVWLLFALLAAIAVFFTFTLVANIVASPFNGMLAEAVERHLGHGGVAPEFSWGRLLAEVRRTVVAELRKLLYIALRALPLVVISVIPVINVAAPGLWLLFGAWMLCLEYLDCPHGNHGALFPRVVDAMRERRRLALGFGMTMTFITIVPVLNFIAMPVGVAGATSLYCGHYRPQ